MTLKGKKLLICAGGTGGHVFAGIAVAQEWACQGGEAVFVGTPRGLEKDIVPRYGFGICLLNVGRLKGSGLMGKLKTFLLLPRALAGAIRIVWDQRPFAVLGVGGYASGPVCLAARLLGMPTAVLEQNAHAGLTNRILGRFVDRIYVAFPAGCAFFNHRKTLLTGNPVRREMVKENYEMPGREFCILVFGGSQGALALNRIFLEAVERLHHLWGQLRIYHQTGRLDEDKVRAFYSQKGIDAQVQTFFHNMHETVQKAHLVVCRAGAGTLTELSASARPALLVPYPHAADDHQKKNAQYFVEQNAAWMIEQKDLSADRLALLIEHLYQNPRELEEKSRNAKRLARPGAQREIVEDLKQRGNV